MQVSDWRPNAGRGVGSASVKDYRPSPDPVAMALINSDTLLSTRTPSEATRAGALIRGRFPPGSHVRVSRFFYYHHAIVVEGDYLIEFGSGLFGGVVARVRWEDFARGGHVELMTHPDSLPPGMIVARATSCLGRGRFSLLDANCEHFATWCATDRWASPQADRVREALMLGGVLGGVLLGKRMLADRRRLLGNSSAIGRAACRC